MVKEDMNFDVDPLMGKKVKDIVTGFEGVVTGVVIHLTGCKQYVVKPKIKKDGSVDEGVMADESRLQVVSQGIRPKEVKKKPKDSKGAMNMPKGFARTI